LKSSNPQNNELFEGFKSDVLKYKSTNFNVPDFELAHKYIYVMTQVFSGMMSENAKMVDLKGKYKSKYNAFIKRLENDQIQLKLSNLITSNVGYDTFINKYDDKDMLL
jgi:hypothetical protein